MNDNSYIWSATYNAQNRPTHFTRENADGTRTVITAAYDYLGRRAWKKVETIATDPATGEETATVTLHQRYIYRGYLQVAACDLTRGSHPCLWLITWDPTQSTATRPLAIQKDGTWYVYGWDLTKNICEVFGQAGYIRTTYSYTPYGSVTTAGDVTQPFQWSSEYADPELSLVYYNYRSYNPTDGRWNRRDIVKNIEINLFAFVFNTPEGKSDYLGLLSFDQWLDILDQTADVKNILSGLGASLLIAICMKVSHRVINAVCKGDSNEAMMWEKKKSIICNLAHQAARASLNE